MPGGNRVDIQERDCVLILIDLITGGLALYDLAKDAARGSSGCCHGGCEKGGSTGLLLDSPG